MNQEQVKQAVAVDQAEQQQKVQMIYNRAGRRARGGSKPKGPCNRFTVRKQRRLAAKGVNKHFMRNEGLTIA